MLLSAAAHAAQAAPVGLTVTDKQGAPVVNAVVSVNVRGTPAVSNGRSAEIAQRSRRFAPDVLAVQQGTSVSFPNFDTVRHHVYSFSAIKKFELKLYAGTPSAPVVFDAPGTAVLGCNIHDGMTAYVRVVDTPYFATTDAEGRIKLDLPSGSHTVKVWHAGLGAESEPAGRPLAVGAGGLTTTLRIEEP